MPRRLPSDPAHLREEIAQAAARMIAEDGADYATAKRKAVRQLLGDVRVAGEWLPDNDMVEEEVRAYQALFHSDSQPRILALLRRLAVLAMAELAGFRPYLVGAALNGTATEHSDVYLQCFCDSPKDVALHLLNAGVDFETSETRHFAGRGEVETLSFLWRGQWPASRETRELSAEVRAELGTPVGIHIALYDADDERGAVRADASGRIARADLNAVRALLATAADSGQAATAPRD
ncbi:UDP-N-acetylmuramate--alanine ligase [Cupriavidus sp. USMAHM13]|uniref:UDP-N-acetylmuramate--alanine ligase n=1 Tax=Cupriavidus malaysiensis TaxID=367825 RepID=A0ABN4TRS9_9BURK|nr:MULTISPECIES: UDP-N-acetylmuramate--alanine ligase [Cupriavidus]AOZ00797.1 UDP-N-acetylmuramate--alanine ligase [Cupriavidus sp. USMAHM13]AOZ07555.1 UDP-N-acetylmuramate--alanine ligase [Cupriavidus malaysiensis]